MKPFRAITWTDVDGREAGLIQRCAARDEDACAELVASTSAWSTSSSLNLLGDHNEALDLSQEVFLRVFRTIHGFRGQSALRTWIYRIVVNQARNRQRWWRRRHRGQQVSLDEHLARSRRLPGAGTTGSPDRLLGRKELADTYPDRARRAAVRPEDGTRAARDRRTELRRNWVFAGYRGRDRQVPACSSARSIARAIEGRMTLLTCVAVRRRLPAFYDRELPIPDRLPSNRTSRDCPPCAGELEDIRQLGDVLRCAAARARPTTGPACSPASSAACAPRRTRRGPRAPAACSTTCTSCGLASPRRSPPWSAACWRSAPCSSPRPSATTRSRR